MKLNQRIFVLFSLAVSWLFGCAMADDRSVPGASKQHWSFRSIQRPEVPEPDAGSPIDAFINKRLVDAGLSPNAPSARRALIRRATYDLTGLPPTPAQVEAFANDRDPSAYGQLIERLLDSPTYGEKWGRHWLDLVRFAETNSYERDDTKPNAWRYRDYVIDSFNDDKSYDQFLREQLAGDEMTPRTPERLIATGYYRLGIWDDEPADELQALYDDLDDVLTVTSQVFLGLTINCARCHDHKLDPIPQADYYRMLAFFSGIHRYGGPGRNARDVKYSQVPLLPNEQAVENQARLDAYRQELARVDAALTDSNDRFTSQLPPGDAEDFAHKEQRLTILQKFRDALFTSAEVDAYGALVELRQQLQQSAPPEVASALAVTERGPAARPVHVLQRGSPHAPAEEVAPGYPSVLGFEDPDVASIAREHSSGRRTVLAEWIASSENPLTARVTANRVWQYHFGKGLVATPNDFGLQGARPTHPELLDWLASELIAHDWSLKHLHRVIMQSAAYQRSSADNAAALSVDPDNTLLWRFPMRRLTAEETRDSLLAITGQLNLKMGGPSIYPEIEDEVKAGQSRPGQGWGTSSESERNRRSVYIFVKRSLITPLIAALDGAEPDFSCPVRFATTTPTQSLTLMNGRYLQHMAARLAERAAAERDQLHEQIAWVLHQVTQRPATSAEVDRGLQLIASLIATETYSPMEALTRFCLVAFNLNEFVYLD